MQQQNKKSVVFLGATGAVGANTLKQLLSIGNMNRLLLLGRRNIDVKDESCIEQQIIEIHQPESYASHIQNVDVAICTLGVGEPSKISKEEFIRIDKTAVLNFAESCKNGGVKHFQLLSSVSIDANSRNFFLRTKGELVEELKKLNFERMSIFQPSMILTPTNRYGLSQAIVLAVWPKLNFILQGGARKYRGIKVEQLGKAIANNVWAKGSGLEFLEYDQFINLNKIF